MTTWTQAAGSTRCAPDATRYAREKEPVSNARNTCPFGECGGPRAAPGPPPPKPGPPPPKPMMDQNSLRPGDMYERQRPITSRTIIRARPRCQAKQVHSPMPAKEVVDASTFVQHLADAIRPPPLGGAYAPEILGELYRKEEAGMPGHNYIEASGKKSKARSFFVEWLLGACEHFKLRMETAQLAVNVADRYLASHGSLGQLTLVGLTALFMAAKYEELIPLSVDEILKPDAPITPVQVRDMEQAVLQALDFRLTVPTPIQFLELLARANGCAARQRRLAGFIVRQALVDGTTLKHPPSVVVSATLLLSNQLLGRRVLWPRRMVRASGRNQKELTPLADELRSLCGFSNGVQRLQRRWLRKEGAASMPQHAYVQGQAEGASARRSVVVLLQDVHRKLDFRTATLHLAVNIVDRYLSARAVEPSQWQKVGVAAMFIAAQFEERHAPEAEVFAETTSGLFTKDDVLGMEKAELEALEFYAMVPTPVHVLEFWGYADCCNTASGEMPRVILEKALVEGMTSKYTPLELAAAALFLSNELAGRQDLWSHEMAHTSGLSHAELASPVEELRSLVARDTRLQKLQFREEAAPLAQRRKVSTSRRLLIGTQSGPRGEATHRAAWAKLRSGFGFRLRATFVSWLTATCRKLKYLPTTLQLAVNIVDRYLVAAQAVYPSQLQLVGAAAVFIAALSQESLAPKADVLADTASGCTEAQLLAMKTVVLDTLKGKVNLLTFSTP